MRPRALARPVVALALGAAALAAAFTAAFTSAAPARADAGSLPVVVLHAARRHQPGKVDFVDPATLAVRGSAGVEGSPWPLRFDPAGATLHVFGAPAPGAAALQSRRPWTLSRVAVAGAPGTLVGEAGRAPLVSLADRGSTRLYVAAKPHRKVTTIAVFDLAGGRPLDPLARIERFENAALSADGSLLYALCEGRRHRRPRGPAGNLHVLDATSGAELARLDVGPQPSSVAFDPDRGLAYVLGVADIEGNGRVTVLRGAAVAGTIATPGRALALASGPGGTLHVLAQGAVLALAADGVGVARTWRLGFDPGELVFDVPRGRTYAVALRGSKIAELDPAGDGVLVEHAVGRAGVKVAQGVGRTLFVVVAVGATFLGGVPVVPAGAFGAAPASAVLAPDGAFLFVLNPYTNDVTLFDTAKRDVAGFLPTGEGSIRVVRTPGEANFWVESRMHLVRINVGTREIDRTIDLGRSLFGPASVAYDRPRGRAWILSRAGLRVVDLRSGEIVGTVESGDGAFGVWIDDAPRAAQGPGDAPAR